MVSSEVTVVRPVTMGISVQTWSSQEVMVRVVLEMATLVDQAVEVVLLTAETEAAAAAMRMAEENCIVLGINESGVIIGMMRKKMTN